ncbi:MAG: hypothetical protein FIA95_08810, partial [Gemmatimonadetes bacterium]|nr:hypothetical protein [Gemmatimonadota bacterium]
MVHAVAALVLALAGRGGRAERDRGRAGLEPESHAGVLPARTGAGHRPHRPAAGPDARYVPGRGPGRGPMDDGALGRAGRAGEGRARGRAPGLRPRHARRPAHGVGAMRPAAIALRAAVLCALLAGPAPHAARAQAVRELTVEESVRMGLERNPRLRAARADADAAREGERQVGAARLPALRSTASYGRLSGNVPPVEFTIPGFDSTFTFQGVQLDRLQTELSLEVPLLSQIRLGHET